MSNGRTHRRLRPARGRLLAGMLATAAALAPLGAAAQEVAGDLCLPAIAAAERQAGVPTHLLRSIAFVESGRRDPATGRLVPWPWTINAAGAGQFFPTRAEAVAAVRDLQQAGVRSIDVGCGQVNLLHHPQAFASLEDAFDPVINVSYAARFLRDLRAVRGSWPAAAAAYHSLTPERGEAYAGRVMALWPDAARHGWTPAARGTAPPVDYGLYTPEFAARLRRMDESLNRAAPLAAPPGPVWIARPPAPEPIATPPRGGGRRGRTPG